MLFLHRDSISRIKVDSVHSKKRQWDASRCHEYRINHETLKLLIRSFPGNHRSCFVMSWSPDLTPLGNRDAGLCVHVWHCVCYDRKWGPTKGPKRKTYLADSSTLKKKQRNVRTTDDHKLSGCLLEEISKAQIATRSRTFLIRKPVGPVQIVSTRLKNPAHWQPIGRSRTRSMTRQRSMDGIHIYYDSKRTVRSYDAKYINIPSYFGLHQWCPKADTGYPDIQELKTRAYSGYSSGGTNSYVGEEQNAKWEIK